MQWLTPFVGLVAAAVAIPLLLLLYFLKLKRREAVVSSTLLWKRAVQDLQVNAPFQRLRRNLLLLLQLLALTAMLVALAGPVLSLDRGPGQRYVVLIDRSASMNATDVTPSRLEEAKRQAKVFIESLRNSSAMALADSADHAMVIAFDRHARVMCNFTSDKRGSWRPLTPSRPVMGRRNLARPSRSPGRSPSRRGSTMGLAATSGLPDWFCSAMGASTISTRFPSRRMNWLSSHRRVARQYRDHGDEGRRSYEQPEQVEIFISLANYGTQTAARDVQLASTVTFAPSAPLRSRLTRRATRLRSGRPQGGGQLFAGA
jgi:hypothetical protein